MTEPAPTVWPHSPLFGPIAIFEEGISDGNPWLYHVESAIDWLGNRFHVGGKVMYCIAAGRGQVMAIGTVQIIRAREALYFNPAAARYASPFSALGTHTGWEVEVRVLTEKTSAIWANKRRVKPAWVRPFNITALP